MLLPLIVVASQNRFSILGQASDLPLYNVKDFGVKGDGVTDDTAAINAVQASIAPTGGVLYFPAGVYLIGGNGIVLRKSNVVFRGEGRDVVTLRRSGTTGNIIVSSPSYPGLSNFAVEQMTLDRNGRSLPGYQPAIVLYGAYLTGARVVNVRFWDSPSINLALSGMDGVLVENSEFLGRGDAIGSGISMSNGTKNVTVRGSTFSYLADGIIVGTANGQYQSTGIVVDNNTFDLGWWVVKAKMSGEGGSVTYTGTTLTDTTKDFTPLFPLAANSVSYNVRVMPVRDEGTGQYSQTTISDSTAQYLTNGVLAGEIVRVGDVFAVIDKVVSETELTIEKWIDNQEYTIAQTPSSGDPYKIYGVYIGKLSQLYGTSTATTLKTQRWHDLHGNTVTPASGTKYEVLVKRPNYPLHAEIGTAGTQIINNRFVRGWSDQISHYGTNATVTNNTVVDGQDVGLTIHGTNNTISSNNISHQGSVGIWIFGDDNTIVDNTMSDTPYENFVNTISLGCVVIEGGERNQIERNICNRNAARTPLGRYGYVIQGVNYATDPRYGDAVDNILRNNRSEQHTVADYYIFGRNGAVARGTVLENNIGTVLDQGVDTIIVTPSPSPTPTVTPTPSPAVANTPTPTVTLIPTFTLTPSPTRTPTPSQKTVTLNPIDDSYVRADATTSNYGNVSSLSTDNSPVRYTYLKFDLTPYAGKTLISAVLKLRTGNDTSTGTQSLKTVTSTSWSEGVITYSDRPSINSATIGSFVGRSRLRWYEMTITSALSAKMGQLASFAIVPSNNDSLSIYSSESSSPPQLVLTYR